MKNVFEHGTIILASASPRRTQLLGQAGIEHLVIPSQCEEKMTSKVPQEVVMELSSQKAEDVYGRYKKEHSQESFLVIGSDTVVAVEGKILGKPKEEQEAFEMLSMLQGRTHQVFTGVTLLKCVKGKEEKDVFYGCSYVDLYPMREKEIRDYIMKEKPFDKAGSYGIQGRFAIYIRSIKGDYNNIVGLPLSLIYQKLRGDFYESNK